MDNESTMKWIVGMIGTALLGLYGLFINHSRRHVEREDLAALKEKVQYKDNCQEIVKRLDQNHKEVTKKLDRILERVE